MSTALQPHVAKSALIDSVFIRVVIDRKVVDRYESSVEPHRISLSRSGADEACTRLIAEGWKENQIGRLIGKSRCQVITHVVTDCHYDEAHNRVIIEVEGPLSPEAVNALAKHVYLSMQARLLPTAIRAAAPVD